MQIKKTKVKLINLGCRVNLFESSAIIHDLKLEGATIVDSLAQANICIINTCTVTSRADAKTKYFINKACKQKDIDLVVVIGCYSQLNEINNNKVGIVLGTKYKNQLMNLIEQYDGMKIIKVDSLSQKDNFENFSESILFISTRAFLKIQDGCDYRCSYCLIPFARGTQRSMNHARVIDLIKTLVNKKYKEIVLSGVNVAGYKDEQWDFYQLLKHIDQIDGNFRIRISSIEPFQINKAIIDLITSNPKRWCQHFHICIQSASDDIIRDMRRKYSIQEFIDLCNYIRNKNPLASITTDYIVGFPTETERHFNESIQNLEKIKFCYMHIFPYSKREGTAASKLVNLVSDTQKKKRYETIHALMKKTQIQYLKSFTNKVVNVLFENSSEINIQVGHSEFFFTVKIETNKKMTNELRQVRIISLKHGQLFGQLI